MKKFTKVICAIVALVMILNTPPQIYAAEPPTDAEKTNLSATEKIEPIEPTPTDPDAKIYGIKLSQNREFLLPGGTLQLTVRGITDPDEIPEIPQSPYLTEDSYSDESNMYLENENELNETYATTIESEDETYELNEPTTQKPEIDAHISTTVAECLPFEWNSCDKEIATVDQNGKVTAISTGTTSITVTTADKVFMDVCEIMVVNKLPNPNNGEANEILSIWDVNHYGTAINWTNQYETTTSTTAVRTVTPGTAIEILGRSGGFYYARLAGESKAYYMWADGIYDRTSLGAVDIALKSNTSDKRKHRDVYISNKIELYAQISSGMTSNYWHSTNDTIATVSSSGVVTAKSEGNVCITVDQGGKKDAIHITVIKRYLPAKYGIVNKNWCGEYRCGNANCTIQGRKVTDWAPYNELIVYGISGGFYYGKIVSSNNYTYFWKDNVCLQTWSPKCEIIKSDSDPNYFPQGFTMDNNYCYAFKIAVNDKNEEIAHKLYRYNISTGEQKLMTPQNAIGNLYHANDAALVTFNENGVNQQYLFVAAWSSKKKNYIVKLGIDSNGNYWKAAQYKLDNTQIVGITLLSGGGSSPATFLLKGGNSFYKVIISSNKENEKSVWDDNSSLKFVLTGNAEPKNTAQGIHYDQSTDKLYLAVSGTDGKLNYNKVLIYSGIRNASGNISNTPGAIEINRYDLNDKNSKDFEVEGVAFKPNSSDKQMWFWALDTCRDVRGRICLDSRNTR